MASPRVPRSQVEPTIDRLTAQLASERAFSNTLRGYLQGWERLYQVWREDLEYIRDQDARIHQLEHDLDLERRENQLLRRENDMMHEERELQYLRNSDPRENGQNNQMGEGSQRHQRRRANSRESARASQDHIRVAVQRSDPAFGLDGRADNGFNDLCGAYDDIDEEYTEEPMYEDDVRPPFPLQETFDDTREPLYDEESGELEGDTEVHEDSGYESATAVDSDSEDEIESHGSPSEGGDEYESERNEGTRSRRSGSESSESEGSDTAILLRATRVDTLVRTLTRLVILAVHRVRTLRLRSPRT